MTDDANPQGAPGSAGEQHTEPDPAEVESSVVEGPFDEATLEALPAHDPDDPVDRADVIGAGGRWLAAWAGRFLLCAAALFVLGLVIGKIWDGVLPVLLALLIASVLWPVVALLHRARIPYGLGAIVSILAGFGVVVGLVSVIAPSVVAQWPSLWSSAISGVRKLQAWAAEPPLNVRDEQLNDWIDQGLTWIQSHSGALLGQALSFGGSLGSGAVTLLLTLVLTFFFLKDGHRFVGFTRRVVGRKAGFHATELLTRLWNTLSGYIRTQALVSLVDAVFIGLGLVIMGVPLAIPIAVLTFMAGFIPMVGAVTAGALAVLVALVSNGLTTAVLVLVLVIAVQQLEGNILQPILQARVMQLHPAVVLLSVLLGGVWAGIIGAFIAVPVAAMIAVVLRYLGDLIDLRTGERSASDITWATDDGHTVASESERSAAFFKAIVRGRSAERNGHAGGHDDGEDRKHGGHPTWRERLLGRRPDGQAEEEPPGDGRDD